MKRLNIKNIYINIDVLFIKKSNLYNREINMPDNVQKLINLRIDLSLYKQYKSFCKSNNTNVSSALREHIKDDLGLNCDVKTNNVDFRDNLNDGFHNIHRQW